MILTIIYGSSYSYLANIVSHVVIYLFIYIDEVECLELTSQDTGLEAPPSNPVATCQVDYIDLATVSSREGLSDERKYQILTKGDPPLKTYPANCQNRRFQPGWVEHILKKCLRDGEDLNLLADTEEEDEQHADTRWLTRIDSIDCLLKNFKSICTAVEEVRDLSTGQSANDAESFLKRLLSFEFITAAVISHHVLGFTRPLTVALQAKSCDLLKAHFMARHLVTTLQAERTEDKFQKLWKGILDISVNLGIEPAKRRTIAVQRHRVNPPVNSEKDAIAAHYRIAYYNAFLDHTISHLNTRFPQELNGALLASYLTPGRIKHLTTERIQSIKEEFRSVLPFPSAFESEISTWKVHVSEIGDVSLRDELWLAASLAQQHHQYYPNIRAVLMLLISLPVGSCSCERSFSSLKRLKSWCRNSMSNKRLDSLSVVLLTRRGHQLLILY